MAAAARPLETPGGIDPETPRSTSGHRHPQGHRGSAQASGHGRSPITAGLSRPLPGGPLLGATLRSSSRGQEVIGVGACRATAGEPR